MRWQRVTTVTTHCYLEGNLKNCENWSQIIIIIIIIIIMYFMQGIYNYVRETNHVRRVYSFAAVLYVQFMLHALLFPC
jgi:hypothetical protein